MFNICVLCNNADMFLLKWEFAFGMHGMFENFAVAVNTGQLFIALFNVTFPVMCRTRQALLLTVFWFRILPKPYAWWNEVRTTIN